MSKKKILVTPKSFSKARDKAYELLKDIDAEIMENNTGRTYTEEEMENLCKDVDGVIVGIDPMNERVLRSARHLKAISKYGAGLDNIDLNTAQEMGIKVDRAVATNATSVAELAVGFMFTMSRYIVPSAICVKQGGWDRSIGRELTDKTVGIVGLGAIGREVARMTQGLGMKILAYDPYFNDKRTIEKYDISMVDLEELFKKSDFITLHSPLTDETENMINKETLSMMKHTAYLINTSRGGLINEEDLYNALVVGTIAGAAQDVFSKEPAGNHKLLSLDNFILTPHIGAFTKEATERMVVQSTKNLINMLE
ncbi:phosphoglycerate dehydrogenase [Xylanivirga thermophila]|jgi:D-3-phosphoglycerate dehydrogenase|uniref:phosphoglycerate dehydrogenase n=1 Tax=Xylanivirga thermophila TaxID=2496273 RepID=UPI00101B6945|nr:phosphoglycerate dehydrogenase [Xylanivirga thermophila]